MTEAEPISEVIYVVETMDSTRISLKNTKMLKFEQILFRLTFIVDRIIRDIQILNVTD